LRDVAATQVVRDAESTGRYAGRSSAIRSLNTVIPRVHATRSTITVAGIAGIAGSRVSCSRIGSSNASTADPRRLPDVLQRPSEAIAARTVFRETPNVLAMVLMPNPSARCSRRISAQSSTDNNSLRSSRLE
jgi:hypothetical protein